MFRLLEKYGKIAHREMFNIFNMGIGMVIAVSQDEASEVIAILEKQGEKASVIGRATDRRAWKSDRAMKTIAVFASGNGSNFEALAAACADGRIAARIALMVCDKPGLS